MNHLVITKIYAYMCIRTRRFICICKEYDVARLRLGFRNLLALTHHTVTAAVELTPYAALDHDIADKSGAVKSCRWRFSSASVADPHVLLRI